MLWPDLLSHPKLPALAPALTWVLSCSLQPDGFPFSFLRLPIFSTSKADSIARKTLSVCSRRTLPVK